MSLQVLRGRELKPPSRGRSTARADRRSATLLGEAGKVQSLRAGSLEKRTALRFPVSPETRSFYRQFYPGTSTIEWNDWRWQMRARVRTLEELERIFRLSRDERAAVGRDEAALPVGIPPYYASLMGLKDAREPLRRTHIMTGDEYVLGPG